MKNYPLLCFLIVIIFGLIIGGLQFYALYKGLDGKVFIATTGILSVIIGYFFKEFRYKIFPKKSEEKENKK